VKWVPIRQTCSLFDQWRIQRKFNWHFIGLVGFAGWGNPDVEQICVMFNIHHIIVIA